MTSDEGGYVDLQVNGYAGVDFNDEKLSHAQLHDACQRLRADGVRSILATVITERVELMAQSLARLVALRDSDDLVAEVIVGFHIEGPFLSKSDGYRGAHPEDAILPADRETMQRLLDAAGGLTRLVTLAPESDPEGRVTRMLVDQRVVVSAGHCDPTLDQLNSAIDAGLSAFTHLGNACPLNMHRHDNVIQRVLSRAQHLHLGLIADGVHVPYFALGNYLRAAGIERCFVVSDATAAAGLGPGRFRLGRWEVEVDENLAAWAPDRSHLVGSAITMQRAHRGLVEQVGLSEAQAAQLTRDTPCRLIGLE